MQAIGLDSQVELRDMCSVGRENHRPRSSGNTATSKKLMFHFSQVLFHKGMVRLNAFYMQVLFSAHNEVTV